LRSAYRDSGQEVRADTRAENADRIEITIKELGDFTSTIKELSPGETVYVDGPYGNFSMDEHHYKDIIFIAGGIGSAPVMSMLRTFADRGCDRHLTFFYGNPTWESIIYREELAEIEEKIDLNLVHVLERPPEDWQGEKGFINAEVLKRNLPENYKDCTFFLCGPLPMIEAVERALHSLEVPLRHIHSEQYEMA